MRRRQPHPFDVVVDFGVFFDELPRSRDICLGLIVVVIAYEIFYGVMREKLFKFGKKLSGKRFVRSDDEGRALNAFDDRCDRKRLSAPGNAQKRLRFLTVLQSRDEHVYGARLVAARRKWAFQSKFHNAPVKQKG